MSHDGTGMDADIAFVFCPGPGLDRGLDGVEPAGEEFTCGDAVVRDLAVFYLAELLVLCFDGECAGGERPRPAGASWKDDGRFPAAGGLSLEHTPLAIRRSCHFLIDFLARMFYFFGAKQSDMVETETAEA